MAALSTSAASNTILLNTMNKFTTFCSVAQKWGHSPLQVKKMTNISQGSVVTCLRCGGPLMKTSIQVYCWFSQWKKLQNRPTFGNVRIQWHLFWLKVANVPAFYADIHKCSSQSKHQLTIQQLHMVKKIHTHKTNIVLQWVHNVVHILQQTKLTNKNLVPVSRQSHHYQYYH